MAAAAPHVRLATGFRWPLRTAATTRDLVRVWVDDGVSLLAVGNGYETGFSPCWPTGSRLLLDRLEAAWAAG